MSEAMILAKEVQAFAGKLLHVETPPPLTDIEEWNLMQQHLSIALKELETLHGNTPEEEGEIVLAILMGYCIAVRNGKKVMQALQRAEQVIHQLDDELLKCKLAVHCYVEFPDKKLAAMVLSLLEEVKTQGNSEEIQQVENFFRMIVS